MASNKEQDGDVSLPPEIGQEEISLPLLEYRTTSKAGFKKPNAPAAAFAPGDLLANRYRILSLISSGGMGEVYEADDLELEQRIAIKTILPAIVRSPQALALLKSEVLMSLQVTHPNVCRVFNLDCHRSASQEIPPVWFVTMELIQGHTLSWEIKKIGKFTTERALPIAQQMANGLEAARRARIVHGDFKSGNVILAPSADGTVRAVITDFGLALTLEKGHTSRAAKVGTPAYMAPEQVSGDELSPQTDVYSFGVVLYEMVTGQWPFNANTPDEISAKRLTESPTPPVRFVPNLDPAWNRAILKCLAREPSGRYPSAKDAIDEITGRSRHLRRLSLVVAAIFLTAIGLTVLARYRELGPFRPKPEIAVMGWMNRSGDPSHAWISTELSERLANTLRQSTTDEVLPQQEIDRAKIEFSVPADRNLEQEDLSQFRTALGANAFIVGAYSVDDDRVEVDGVLQNAKGRALKRFHEEAPLQALAQVAEKIATDLSETLDSKEVTEQQLESSASIYPKDAEARMLYFEATENLSDFDADSAREKLQQVVALDNDSVAAHAALAEAWSRLKHDREAIEEGRKAVELAQAQKLPPELMHLMEARYAELQLRWADAAERYKNLHDFFPNVLSYSLHYAAALIRNGQPTESERFLEELSKSPKPVGDDPRIQSERAEAFAAESNFAEELKAADQALNYASARKEKLMQADAELQVCWAQQNTGHSPAALEACETARGIFSTFDDNINAAVALNGIANIKMQQADYTGARQAYLQVLEVTQKANAQTDTAGALLNLGKSEIYLGDNSEAESHLRQAIDLAERIEDHNDESKARISLGSILDDAGKKTDATEQYGIALKIAEQTGDRNTQAYVLSNLGQMALDDHNYTVAERDLEKALTLREAMDETLGVAKLQLRLADLQLNIGNREAARNFGEKARATAEKLADMGTFADALCALAEVDLSSGNLSAALEKSAQAVGLYQSQHDTDGEAQAHLLSAKAFIATRNLKSAAQEVASAQAFPGPTEATKDEIARLSREIQHMEK